MNLHQYYWIGVMVYVFGVGAGFAAGMLVGKELAKEE